ncbi:MAG: helix-turn-helix transcriptional regulator [Pseudonocardiaceae bacterium]
MPVARHNARAPAMFRPEVVVRDLNGGIGFPSTARQVTLSYITLTARVPDYQDALDPSSGSTRFGGTSRGVLLGTQAERRAELAGFLKAHRQQVDRSELALPPVIRGRPTGLRREEVAFLSGVSVTWYTWLEQARDIRPSRQVLEAVARALRLTVREHAYVLELAGYSATHLEDPPIVRAAPEHVQHLLDVLTAYPAYAIAPDWGISGWNHAYEALYPNVATVPAQQRNLLWLVFTDPCVRELLPNWETDSRHFLAQFRADAGARLGDPAFSSLVSRLLDASETFREWWENHAVEPFTSRERWFHHPVVGDLQLEHHRLAPSDQPDLHVIIYTPVDSETTSRLRQLLTCG